MRILKKKIIFLLFCFSMLGLCKDGFGATQISPEVIDFRLKNTLPSVTSVVIKNPAFDPDVNPAFSVSGMWMVTQMKNGSLALWSTFSGKLQTLLKPSSGMSFSHMKLSPTQEMLVASLETNSGKAATFASGIQIWELPKGNRIGFFPKEHVQKLEFSSDGKYLMLGIEKSKEKNQSCQIEIWSLEEMQHPKPIFSEEYHYSCFSFQAGIEPKNGLIWINNLRMSIMTIWDLPTKKWLYSFHHIIETEVMSEAIAGTAFVQASRKPGEIVIGFNPRDSRKEPTLYQLEAKTGKEIAKIWPMQYKNHITNLLAVSPSGETLLAQTAFYQNNQQPENYSQQGGVAFKLWEVLHQYVFGAQKGEFSPDGQKVLLNFHDRDLWLYRFQDRASFQLEGVGVNITSHFSPDSHTLQTAGLVSCKSEQTKGKKIPGFCLAVQTWLLD